jgi:hypothetical protein
MNVTSRTTRSEGAHELPQIETSVIVHAKGGHLPAVALHLSADLSHSGMLDCRHDDMLSAANSSIAFEPREVVGLRSCPLALCGAG